MTLENFIKQFICKNTIIRLWYKSENCSHTPVIHKEKDVVSMEWEVINKTGPYKNYVNNQVIGVTDILVIDTHYSEAVNIVIDKNE